MVRFYRSRERPGPVLPIGNAKAHNKHCRTAQERPLRDGGRRRRDPDVEVVLESAFTSKRVRWPQGQKSAKAMDYMQKQKEIAVCAQARATAELAAANLRKAEVLSDQAAFSLFTMPNEEWLSDEAREYLSLKQQGKMAKLRKRLAHERHEEAEAVVEAARLDKERAADLVRAQRGRIPPSLLQRPVSPHVVPAMTPTQHSPLPSLEIGGGENSISGWIHF